jgi:hypothetical protein
MRSARAWPVCGCIFGSRRQQLTKKGTAEGDNPSVETVLKIGPWNPIVYQFGTPRKFLINGCLLVLSFSVDREQKHGLKKIHILIVHLTVVGVFGSIWAVPYRVWLKVRSIIKVRDFILGLRYISYICVFHWFNEPCIFQSNESKYWLV